MSSDGGNEALKPTLEMNKVHAGSTVKVHMRSRDVTDSSVAQALVTSRN